MRWPWFISIYSLESIVNPLLLQLSELKEERKVLLDRLGTIGLGGPLFSLPSQQDSSANMVTEAESIEDAEAAELAHIQSLRRTPSKMAAYLTRKAYRDANTINRGPSVARIPDMSKINDALDQAEAVGKQMSGAEFAKYANAELRKKKA
jgi:hypothetical protein